MNIGELADAAGLARRTVRFYVQRGLLESPHGRGRGSEYDEGHLQRLRRIQELQLVGHSLDAIAKILTGQTAPEPTAIPTAPARRRRALLSAELWTRLRIGEDVELHFDASKLNPDVSQLLAIRQAIRDILGLESMEGGDGNGTDERRED